VFAELLTLPYTSKGLAGMGLDQSPGACINHYHTRQAASADDGAPDAPDVTFTPVTCSRTSVVAFHPEGKQDHPATCACQLAPPKSHCEHEQVGRVNTACTITYTALGRCCWYWLIG